MTLQIQVEITYAQNQRAHKVVLMAKCLDVFVGAAKDPDITCKQGEALVAALLKNSNGNIFRAERCKDGKCNDGPNGEPAIQIFNDSGTLIEATRYKDNKLNDGPNGEPASQQFSDGGTLIEATRWKDGKCNDGPSGEPASRQFSASGTLVEATRWKDGKLNDGPNGEPASQQFSDGGTLIVATHYKNGKPIKALTAAEIKTYLAAQEYAGKIRAIQSSFGGQIRPIGPS